MMSSPVVLAAPYPEEAVVQLARAAERQRRLAALVMPSRAGSRLVARAAHVSGRTELARRLRRGAADVARLQEVDLAFEPLRLLGGVPLLGRAAPDVHRLKAGFDRRVARLPVTASALVAMPEAALATFQQHADLLRVFHEVDGHPRARNEVLEQHYGARRAAAEAHSAAVVERIEAELALADLVLTPSAAVSAQMTAHGVSPEHLLQAHLGVDLARFRVASTAGGSRTARREPVLLHVGQVSLRKGIPFLLDAVRGRPVQLRLLGPVVDPRLLEGAPTNVQHAGVVSHQGVAAAMRDADAFVFPTLEDAFGLVLVEAAACGLPVVTTTAAGAAEVLESQDVVLVPPGDAGALGEALQAIEPLGEDERIDRAQRIVQAAASGILNDWDGWAAAVLAGIDGRLAGR